MVNCVVSPKPVKDDRPNNKFDQIMRNVYTPTKVSDVEDIL